MRKAIILTLIATLITMTLSGCSIGGIRVGQKQCNDNRECFEDALAGCTPAKYFPEKGEAIITIGTVWPRQLVSSAGSLVEVEGKLGDKCKLTITAMDKNKVIKLACYGKETPNTGQVFWECKNTKKTVKTTPIKKTTPAPIVNMNYTTS